MKITELKKQLNAMNKAKLISMPCKLYKANRQCQAIFDVEMCGASAEAPLIESCRKKIHTAFFGRQLSLKNARAVISDFRKASQNKESIADLILYYVECGVEFTNLYGDIDERFYSNLESMFADFVRLLNSMENDSFYRRQSKRIRAVFEDTHDIGWGFSDEMARIYFDICFFTRFTVAEKEKKRRSNIESDENGIRRKKTRYVAKNNISEQDCQE